MLRLIELTIYQEDIRSLMSFMHLEIILFLFPLFEIDSMRKRSTGRREICRIQKAPVLRSAVRCTPSSGEILHTALDTRYGSYLDRSSIWRNGFTTLAQLKFV